MQIFIFCVFGFCFFVFCEKDQIIGKKRVFPNVCHFTFACIALPARLPRVGAPVAILRSEFRFYRGDPGVARFSVFYFYLGGRGVARSSIHASIVVATEWPNSVFLLRSWWPRCGPIKHSRFYRCGHGVARVFTLLQPSSGICMSHVEGLHAKRTHAFSVKIKPKQCKRM